MNTVPAESSPAPAPSKSPLLSLDEALERLLAAVVPLAETETVDTFDALGRVLAVAVQSTVDVPPADNSAMDGYALRTADVPAAGTLLPVSQRIPAGTPPQPLATGTAARIFTGAQIPAGADAVVMQELCGAEGDAVRVQTVPALGASIRRRGEDVARGDCVLAAGVRLTPQALGLAASVGIGALTVARRPRVAFFSTGDELVMPGQPLPEGAIYNSNRYMLRGLLEAFGCECRDLGIVGDTLEATRAALREAAACDLVVSCGGVSVGEEDHLKPAVEAEGALQLWQMAIKPGKPLAYGHVRRTGGGTAHFIGLPGNPVSCFVTFALAVRPVLLRLQGAADVTAPALSLRADFEWPKADRRREFLRARLNANGGLDLYPHQGSGVLTSTVWADGLVDNPPNQRVAPGDTVRFLPFGGLLS